jgi:hypothetical protein
MEDVHPSLRHKRTTHTTSRDGRIQCRAGWLVCWLITLLYDIYSRFFSCITVQYGVPFMLAGDILAHNSRVVVSLCLMSWSGFSFLRYPRFTQSLIPTNFFLLWYLFRENMNGYMTFWSRVHSSRRQATSNSAFTI